MIPIDGILYFLLCLLVLVLVYYVIVRFFEVPANIDRVLRLIGLVLALILAWRLVLVPLLG